MHIVRTLAWVILLVALVVFAANNWTAVEIKIWQNLIVETKVPAIVIVAFAIGLVPTWLLYRATKWQLHRRIASLESALASARLEASEKPRPETPAAQEPAPAPPEPPVAPVP